MSTEHQFEVGDRIRIIRPECSCGDYEVGSTAVIKDIDDDGDFTVTWDKLHFGDERDQFRITVVFPREVEPV